MDKVCENHPARLALNYLRQHWIKRRFRPDSKEGGYCSSLTVLEHNPNDTEDYWLCDECADHFDPSIQLAFSKS